MTTTRIKEIIAEVIEEVKWGNAPLNEELEPAEERAIRDIIRKEVSAIFFELFKKRKTWGG